MGKLATVIHVRDGDELTDIAEDINDSSARLQIMVMSMKDNLDMIDGCDLPTETALHLETIRENLAYFETINLADTAANPNEPTQ